MGYNSLKNGFYRGVSVFLDIFYKCKDNLKVYGRNNLEEASKKGRVVIATTHANIKRAIPVGLAIRKPFYLVIDTNFEEDLNRWYIRKNWIELPLRLLSAVWIDNKSKYPRQDIEKIANIIDVNKNGLEPGYVLIAVKGDFNSDNPEEFTVKRGLGLAYKIRLRKNLKKGIKRFNSTIIPSAEFNCRNKYVIIYGKPIDPNSFIESGDFNCRKLTETIESEIRKIMAEIGSKL